jgi:hypothetical protein
VNEPAFQTDITRRFEKDADANAQLDRTVRLDSVKRGGAGPKENARLELEHDGSVTVYVGSAAVGQGLETIIAQIAADARAKLSDAAGVMGSAVEEPMVRRLSAGGK